MTGRLWLAAAGAALSLVGASALAQDASAEDAALAALEEALPGTLMNNPYEVDWVVYGDGYKGRVVAREAIPGGYAYEVKVRGKGKNPWDVSVQNEVRDGVAEGDVVLLAFWARAAKGGPVVFDPRVAERVAPYDAAAQGRTTLSEDWQIHYVSGRAPRDWGPGELALNFNVATGKHTLEFGQYYVMNLGPDADLSAMPSGPSDP